jgi:hypothetical protein
MSKFIRGIVLALSLAFVAPACYVYGEPAPSTISVGYTSRSCAPGRYWNGHRCAKRRAYYAPAHYHRAPAHQRPRGWGHWD